MTLQSSMTADEQIAYLATEIMGWEKRSRVWGIKGLRSVGAYLDWNPLTSWDNWRQVEEKVMEGEGDVLFLKYIRNICPYGTITTCTKADLPTRVSALIAAHRSLSES